jgi:hypothetical protein
MYEYYKKILIWSFYASNLLYILTLIGIYNTAPEYLNTLKTFVKIIISLFLIIYFNPYSTHKFTDFDRQIVFTSGIYLLLTTTIIDVMRSFVNNNIQNNIKNPMEKYIIIEN